MHGLPKVKFKDANEIPSPLPDIDEVVEKVTATDFITVVDLTQIDPLDFHKVNAKVAAFGTPFGTFLPKLMTFGLLNATFFFCMLISRDFLGRSVYKDLHYPISTMSLYSIEPCKSI